MFLRVGKADAVNRGYLFAVLVAVVLQVWVVAVQEQVSFDWETGTVAGLDVASAQGEPELDAAVVAFAETVAAFA